MNRTRLEEWAIRASDAVLDGSFTEDDAVEFKREWTDPKKTARRLAAHANAARGQQILWVIGVDEAAHKLAGSVSPPDLADWWPQVQSQFDGPSPDLTAVQVPFREANLMALGFETDRAPYLVKCEKGVEREVPWRDGARTISAKREHLLRILVPVSTVPQVEILHASLSMGTDAVRSLGARLYVTTLTRDAVHLPRHKARIAISSRGGEPVELALVRFEPGSNNSGGSTSFNIPRSDAEVVIHGPGQLYLQADCRTFPFPLESEPVIDVRMTFGVAESDLAASATVQLRQKSPGSVEWLM